ncbi:glycine cleavage system H protein-like protein [Xylariaceae sp. FL0804]|nr:glycine cleavage system H protein-like protein [Xylariaceae sp. FL0804]
MASIARCLRAAQPTTLSRLAAAPVVARRPLPARRYQPSSLRAFSASAIRDVRKYTKDHEWIDVNADRTAGVIGLSEYAAEELGDVVYVELPEVGRSVGAGDAVGAVESVKSAADVNSPCACKVVSTNRALEEKPGLINQLPEDDSHGGGWIARVELDDQGRADLDALMDLDEYKTFTGADAE